MLRTGSMPTSMPVPACGLTTRAARPRVWRRHCPTRHDDDSIRMPPEVSADTCAVSWLPQQGRRLALVTRVTCDQQHPTLACKSAESLGMVRLVGTDVPTPHVLSLAREGEDPQRVRLAAVQPGRQ
jgi:hypothetical protein